MLDTERDWKERVSYSLHSEHYNQLEPALTYWQPAASSKAGDASVKKVSKKQLVAENLRLQRAVLESEFEVPKSELATFL